MEDDMLFSQRSLFGKSKLGFPVDVYETNIGLVIINILFPNKIPGIDNPKKILHQIILSYITMYGLFNLLTKLRNISYILGVDLFSRRFKTMDEVISFSPILDDFINNIIRNNSYLPSILFIMNNETRKIDNNLFEVSIRNQEIDDSSRKYGLQFSNKG